MTATSHAARWRDRLVDVADELDARPGRQRAAIDPRAADDGHPQVRDGSRAAGIGVDHALQQRGADA